MMRLFSRKQEPIAVDTQANHTLEEQADPATTNPAVAELDAEDLELITPPDIDAPLDHPLWPRMRDMLRTVFDPEIPVNIYEMGLIYRVDVVDDTVAQVEMTLTSPGCPVAGTMPVMVQEALIQVDGITRVDVNIVWDPQWTPAMLAPAARVALDMNY